MRLVLGQTGANTVVDMRILVTTQSLSLRFEAQCLCASSIDGGTIVLGLVVAIAAFWLVVLKVVQGLLLSDFLPYRNLQIVAMFPFGVYKLMSGASNT